MTLSIIGNTSDFGSEIVMGSSPPGSTISLSTPYISKEFFIYITMENISQNLVEEFLNDVIIENYEI